MEGLLVDFKKAIELFSYVNFVVGDGYDDDDGTPINPVTHVFVMRFESEGCFKSYTGVNLAKLSGSFVDSIHSYLLRYVNIADPPWLRGRYLHQKIVDELILHKTPDFETIPKTKIPVFDTGLFEQPVARGGYTADWFFRCAKSGLGLFGIVLEMVCERYQHPLVGIRFRDLQKMMIAFESGDYEPLRSKKRDRDSNNESLYYKPTIGDRIECYETWLICIAETFDDPTLRENIKKDMNVQMVGTDYLNSLSQFRHFLPVFLRHFEKAFDNWKTEHEIDESPVMKRREMPDM